MHAEINGPQLDGEDENLYLVPPLPKYPTTIVPGKEKVAVMIERARRGESVFHPQDPCKGVATLPETPGVPDRAPRDRWYGEPRDADEQEEEDPSLYSWWRPAWGPRPPEPPETYLKQEHLEEIRQMQDQQRQEQEQREQEQRGREQRELEQQQQQHAQHAQQPTVSPASTDVLQPLSVDPPRQRKKPGPKPGFRKKQQEQSHDVENGQHRQKRNGKRKQHNRKQYSSHSNHSYTRSWFDPDPEIDSDVAGTLYTLAKKLGGLSQVKRACELLQECAK